MSRGGEKGEYILGEIKKLKGMTLVLVGVLALGVLYMRYTWTRYSKESASRALEFAKTTAVFLKADLLDDANSDFGDIRGCTRETLGHNLKSLPELNPEITDAYLYSHEDGDIYVLAGTSFENFEGPLPAKLLSQDNYIKPYEAGRSMILYPDSKDETKAVHVLKPIMDLDKKEITAVLGLEYSYDIWHGEVLKHTFHAGVITGSIFFIFLAFYLLLGKNTELTKEKDKLLNLQGELKEREELFRTVFEQAPVGITLHKKDHTILDVNPMFEGILARPKEEILNFRWKEFTHPEDLTEDLDFMEKFQQGELNGYSIRKRYLRPDGSTVWVGKITAPLKYGNDRGHMCIITDETKQVEAEEKLRESERSKAVFLANLPGMAYRCSYDRDWTMHFVSEGCLELTGYKSESLIDSKEIAFKDLVRQDYRETLWIMWEQVIATRSVFKFEYPITTAKGEIKWVYEQGQGVFNEEGQVEALEGLIIDITDRKVRDDEIAYLKERDALTGLYNRRSFEKELKKLSGEKHQPLSVIMADVDGIRLINGAFGFTAGDLILANTGKILEESCGPEDFVARIGGDEFAILLPNSDYSKTLEVVGKIKNLCERHNRRTPNKAYYINLSLGYRTRSPGEDIDQVLQIAEGYMYKNKLLKQKSSYSAIVASINATVHEKSQETEEHCKRLAELSKKVGKRLNLTHAQLDDLELLAMLHDIGKVGIDDSILKKTGKLTDEEWKEMEKHPEIGYRIAKASPELAHIAEYILYHHERWDGKGYPEGIKGKEIPLLSRILAVVDAYDAMTQDRIYRKALTKEVAIKELEENAGTQFDPRIVRVFVDQVIKWRSA